MSDRLGLNPSDAKFVALWQNHIDAVKNQPPDRKQCAREVIDAYVICVTHSDQLPAVSLARIAEAAGSSYRMVAGAGCESLARLARTIEPARDVFRTMSRSSIVAARFNAVSYLEWALPELLRREIVTTALCDRSFRVRIRAIEKAFDFRFRDILPTLNAMLQTETHPRVIRTLKLHVPLFQDGYLLEETSGGYQLTFSTMPGSLTGGFLHVRERPDEETIRGRIAEGLARDMTLPFMRERYDRLLSLGWKGD